MAARSGVAEMGLARLAGSWDSYRRAARAMLERWSSPASVAAIARLLQKDFSLRRAAPRLGLEAWEVEFLRRPLARTERPASKRELGRIARSLAFELDLLNRRRLPREATFHLRLTASEF